MDELKKQAAELGIKVDGRWSAERLQAEIDEALEKDPVEVDALAEANAEIQAEIEARAPAAPEIVELDDHVIDLQAPRTGLTITNMTGNRNRTLGLDGFGSVQLTEAQMDDDRLLAKIRHGIKTGVLRAE